MSYINTDEFIDEEYAALAQSTNKAQYRNHVFQLLEEHAAGVKNDEEMKKLQRKIENMQI